MRKRRRQQSRREQFQASQRITQIAMRHIGTAHCYALFLGFDGEPDLRPLLRQLTAQGKQVVVPQLFDRERQMRFVAIPDNGKYRHNSFGIEEPTLGRTVSLQSIDVMLMPLTAFDLKGHRLGMGGGYYDRLLNSRASSPLRRPLRVGVAFHWQEQPAIPHQAWDITLHHVITDRRWY